MTPPGRERDRHMNPDPSVPPPVAPQEPAVPAPGHEPLTIDLATESVAGEEDPGASLDVSIEPGSAPPATP